MAAGRILKNQKPFSTSTPRFLYECFQLYRVSLCTFLSLKMDPSFLSYLVEILSFCDFVAPTPEEREMRSSSVSQVSEVIKGIWPECEVHFKLKFKPQTLLYLDGLPDFELNFTLFLIKY